ncbi:MAG TPA: heavy-metal-associated domain-containing protein [Prosthecobacter sp.]|jgi:copper chaperone CopZ|nr:heavy-metal-associated domain-containing protein [Prosthecobacter sp.]
MRLSALFALLLSLALHAEDKPAPTKTVFVVSGLECGSCVYMVQHQLSQTAGIVEVEVLQGLEGYANVSYDPKLVSEHQIAQAVREAPGLHGMPYIATMKVRVPGLSQHVTQVKALFEKWKPSIELVVWDEHAGELIVNFNELKKDAKGAFPRGWSITQLEDGLKKLGLKFEILSPGGL